MQTAPTLAEYARRWLGQVTPTIRPGTRRSYGSIVRRQLGPLLDRALATLTRRDVRDWLLERLESGFSARYVRTILLVIASVLDCAVGDEVLAVNVARGAGKGLFRHARQSDGLPKAMSRPELARFLAAVRTVRPRQRDYFLVLSRTGLRPGEGLGLQWADLDLERRQARIARTWSDGRGGPTKSGRVRFVDLSRQVVRALEARRAREPLTRWVFQSLLREAPWDRSHVEKAMRAALLFAGLPRRFHPHSLRHTYASLLIEAGWPIQYVQQQLGHASISMTVDTYGSAWRARNLPAVDFLDDPGPRRPPRRGHGGQSSVPVSAPVRR